MAIFLVRKLVIVTYGCWIWMLMSSLVTAETRVEVSLSQSPVHAGEQTVFQCKVWELGSNQQVGISKLSSNNGNTVFVRDSQLLPGTPDNILFDILSPQSDGSTPYNLTIVGVDKNADEGRYSCYVLTVDIDGMVQAVATDSIQLDIVDTYLPPDGYPVCSLAENRLSYFAGEELTLSCSSPDGRPSISLLWVRNDKMEIPGNQTMIKEGDLVIKNMTTKLYEEDNGTVFKCVIISTAFPSNGRECSIGPIAVWKGYVTSPSNNTEELKQRTILGLSETIFVMIIVAAGIIFLVLVILVIVFCIRSYSCACLIRKRKSYRMDGNPKDSTLRGDGTLTAGVELQYVPSRPAPVPPPSYVESQRDTMSQQHYTQQPNPTASSTNKRLSAVESALLLAVTRSLSRPQSTGSIQEETIETEIIYANTSRTSSIVDLHKITNANEEDADSGVVNLGYDGSNGSDDQATAAAGPSSTSHSRSASLSEIVYHNTSDLPIKTQSPPEEEEDIPDYAKVDKSRTSTMESVKKRQVSVEPEAVTTLDSSILYHNTGDLGISMLGQNPLPPPIPANPPSPISKVAKTPEPRRPLSSVGGPEKPAFKPPPPPSDNSRTSTYQNTVIGEGPEEGDKEIPTKPVPPKKPTYKI